jgi:hypothetical protein
VSDRATELFQRFVDEAMAGLAPDPTAYVAQAGEDGEALSAMLAAFLAAQPPSALPEDEVLAIAARPELEPPRPWPQLLPRLREQRGTTRSALVRRLTELLGLAGSEEQVGDYVHALETGQHSPRLVRPAVVQALAEVLRVPSGLLEASRRLPGQRFPGGLAMQSTFSRAALRESAPARMDAAASPPPGDPRVDDLFTGGPDG